MGIPKLNPALSIFLNAVSLGLSVNWQSHSWDFLVCFDADPIPTVDGYYCAFRIPEYRVLYSSREALWQAELFEPFLDWLNNTLFPATWLGLYRGKGGSTWAELLHESDPEAHALLSVWLSQEQEVNNDR